MTVEIVEYLDDNGRSPFGVWFDRLPYAAAAKVVVAVDRMSRGLLGDTKSVGGGISERRIDFGPGYRIYFAAVRKRDVAQMIILLGGGTKKRQNKDVKIAQDRWKKFKSRRRKGER